MIPLIISFIALIFSVISLIIALRKKRENLFEVKINDDLTGIKGLKIECETHEIEDDDKQVPY